MMGKDSGVMLNLTLDYTRRHGIKRKKKQKIGLKYNHETLGI